MNEKKLGHMDKNCTDENCAEEKGIFTERFKSHADSSGVVSSHFRRHRRMMTEEEVFRFLENVPVKDAVAPFQVKD